KPGGRACGAAVVWRPIEAACDLVIVEQHFELASAHALWGMEVEQVVPLAHLEAFGEMRTADKIVYLVAGRARLQLGKILQIGICAGFERDLGAIRKNWLLRRAVAADIAQRAASGQQHGGCAAGKPRRAGGSSGFHALFL